MRPSEREAPEMSAAPGRTPTQKKGRKDATLKCFKCSRHTLCLTVVAPSLRFGTDLSECLVYRWKKATNWVVFCEELLHVHKVFCWGENKAANFCSWWVLISSDFRWTNPSLIASNIQCVRSGCIQWLDSVLKRNEHISMHGGHAAELVRAAELQISLSWTLRPAESLVDHFYFAPSFFPPLTLHVLLTFI